MSSLLIGSTGFVGSTLLNQRRFDVAVHRPDLATIADRQFEVTVCAGAPAQKWIANQDPAADLANLQTLVGHLATIGSDRFVLVSTVDVYPDPRGCDEHTGIDPAANSAYGRNRHWLETQVRGLFPGALIVRLPGLFGTGLRKNVLYDLLWHNALHLTHADSSFQFYDMSRLWSDITIALDAEASLVNLAVAPARVAEIAERCFGETFPDNPEAPIMAYDMHTTMAAAFGGDGHYIADAENVLAGIASWVAAERAAGRCFERAGGAS